MVCLVWMVSRESLESRVGLLMVFVEKLGKRVNVGSTGAVVFQD
jgi:hypothetical protein